MAINETWAFFNEVYAEFAKHHQTSLFQPREANLPVFRERVNRFLFNHDLQALLQANDVVFFEWASGLLTAATHLPKAAGIVARLHRYEMYQWADQVNWTAVDRVILVSQAKAREFSARFPEHAAKIVVIPEAISLARFQPGTRPFAGDIGTLCNLSPRKRVYELILAFAELNRQHAGFRLHIGGGRHPRFPEYYDALRLLVLRLQLEDKVFFYDKVDSPEDWYRQIDIFVSNSYSEGLQVSPMEAIASGCYCLSHGWDGAEELLPADNLYWTDRDLIEQIVTYADLPACARHERQAALLELVRQRFDVDRTKVQIRQVVEEVGTRRKRASSQP